MVLLKIHVNVEVGYSISEILVDKLQLFVELKVVLVRTGGI